MVEGKLYWLTGSDVVLRGGCVGRWLRPLAPVAVVRGSSSGYQYVCVCNRLLWY